MLSTLLRALLKYEDKSSTAYWQGYGKIEGTRLIISPNPVTVWEAIFEVDDPKSLEILRACCYSEPATLARFAKYHGAQRCYDAITATTCRAATTTWKATEMTTMGSNYDMISYKTGSSSLDKWNQVLQRACSYQGIMTPTIYIDALIMWDSFRVTGHKSFLTTSDEDQIKNLLSGDETLFREYSSECNESSQHFPDETSCKCQAKANLHCKIILESWKYVLDNLDGTSKADALDLLTTKLHNATLHHYKIELLPELVDQFPSIHFLKSVNLLTRMTEMLLECGADMQSTEFDLEMLDEIFPSIDERKDVKQWGNVMCRHFRLLITYLYKHLPFDCWDGCKLFFQLGCGRQGMCGVIRSLLPHQLYEAYRLYVLDEGRKSIEEELDEDLNKDTPDSEDVQMLRDSVDFLNDIHAPRSLQELCRLALYQSTPMGKLPQLVREAEIPLVLKSYLTLGVLPMH